MSNKDEGVIYGLSGPDGKIRALRYTKNTTGYAATRVRDAAKKSGQKSSVNAWIQEIGLYNFSIKMIEKVEPEQVTDRLEYWHNEYLEQGADLLTEKPSVLEARKAAKALKPGRLTEYSQEQREAISRANKGKVLSEETRRLISEKNKGHQRNLGRTHTREARDKMSFARHRNLHIEKSVTKADCRWCKGESVTYWL